jgi:predicted RNase H-like HicB family nuclease
MSRRFILEYWIDEGWYVGRLKEVPGIFSQGESLEELEENIRDAYHLMVEEEVRNQGESLRTD